MAFADLVVTDPGCLWASANSWMDTQKCTGHLLVAILTEKAGSPILVFGPFSSHGDAYHGMKIWDEGSKIVWTKLATGASKENSTSIRIRYRYIPLLPPKP